jgi:hypothetical protein
MRPALPYVRRAIRAAAGPAMFALWIAWTSPANAQTWVQAQKLTAPVEHKGFGEDVDVSGSWMIIAENPHGSSPDPTRAFIFRKSAGGWVCDTTFDGPKDFYYGQPVAIENGYAAIGDFLTAQTYVYHYSGGTWSTLATLPYRPTGLAISGGRLFVGEGTSKDVRILGLSTNGCQLQQTITTADPSFYFGSSVAVHGGTLVATQVDTNHVGHAYVYELGGTVWGPTALLTPALVQPNDQGGYGFPVATDGTHIVLGANRSTIGGPALTGAAFSFERSGSGWQEDPVMLAPQPKGQTLYGCSVAVLGDTAAVGAEWEGPSNGTGLSNGALYIYKYNGTSWQFQQQLAPDPGWGAELGFSVAMDDGIIVSGAFGGNTSGPDRGVVYVYAPEPSTLALLAIGVVTLGRRRDRKRNYECRVSRRWS